MNIFYRNGTARITTSGGQFDATTPEELWTLLQQLSDPIIRSGMEREQQKVYAPDKGKQDPAITEYLAKHNPTVCKPGPGCNITLEDLEIVL